MEYLSNLVLRRAASPTILFVKNFVRAGGMNRIYCFSIYPSKYNEYTFFFLHKFFCCRTMRLENYGERWLSISPTLQNLSTKLYFLEWIANYQSSLFLWCKFYTFSVDMKKTRIAPFRITIIITFIFGCNIYGLSGYILIQHGCVSIVVFAFHRMMLIEFHKYTRKNAG